MATNLHIDDALLRKALRLGGTKTKRETVEAALREYVERRERRGILDLAGELEWDPSFDYKRERSRP